MVSSLGMDAKQSQSPYDQRRSMLPRVYEPKKLNPLHHEILRRALLGESHKQIAEDLNCTPATVSNAVNCGLGREKLETLSSIADLDGLEVAREIKRAAPMALKVMQEILEDTAASYAVRLKAAADLLDRAGHGAVKKVDVKRSSVELSPEELDVLKQQALDRALSNGDIIDVTNIEATV